MKKSVLCSIVGLVLLSISCSKKDNTPVQNPGEISNNCQDVGVTNPELFFNHTRLCVQNDPANNQVILQEITENLVDKNLNSKFERNKLVQLYAFDTREVGRLNNAFSADFVTAPCESTFLNNPNFDEAGNVNTITQHLEDIYNRNTPNKYEVFIGVAEKNPSHGSYVCFGKSLDSSTDIVIDYLRPSEINLAGDYKNIVVYPNTLIITTKSNKEFTFNY